MVFLHKAFYQICAKKIPFLRKKFSISVPKANNGLLEVEVSSAQILRAMTRSKKKQQVVQATLRPKTKLGPTFYDKLPTLLKSRESKSRAST